MTVSTFAAAQCSVLPGDITDNIRRHLALMRAAHVRGVQCLVFPELSVTGYELELADALAQAPDTALLAPLRAYARDARMTTVVGLPLRAEGHGKPRIAAFILHADGTSSVHTKQHLHAGEDRHVDAGAGGPLFTAGGLPVALAVCADFAQPTHVAAAARAGARLYAAMDGPGDRLLVVSHANGRWQGSCEAVDVDR